MAIEFVKINTAGAAAPTVTDDDTDGYAKGSVWWHGVNVYDCEDASTGAAVWARRSKSLIVENPQTGTTYTLVLTDQDKDVSMSNASANTLTIPTNASVAFPVGAILSVTMLGAGQTTITADTGVTLNGVSAGSADIGAQYAGVTLRKKSADVWIMQGSHGEVA